MLGSLKLQLLQILKQSLGFGLLLSFCPILSLSPCQSVLTVIYMGLCVHGEPLQMPLVSVYTQIPSASNTVSLIMPMLAFPI